MRLAALCVLILAPQVLLPGATDIASDHLRDGHRVERIFKGDSALGHFTYEWHTMPNGGLLLVTSGEVRSQRFLDSSVVKRRGLAPVSEMAQFGNHVDHFTYDGSTVTRARSTTDSGTTRETHTYGLPVFSFQELDDLLRSLPLRDGYEAILPLYSEGSDTLEMDTVRITGHTGATWTLRFADPAIVGTYDVDERSRAIVRHESVGRKSGNVVRFQYSDLAEPGH